MVEGGHKPRNVLDSRSWEQTSIYGKRTGTSELHSANYLNEQETDLPLEPQESTAALLTPGF